ncbi:MAG: acyltransferase [Bacilli bacterium]|nr:acyltransferase [Bacilli bacterium]
MKKNMNIELVRIIAMLMIVTLHCNLFSTKVVWSDAKKNILFSILEIVCIIAVNLYILITGFFLEKSKFSLKRIIKLELIVVFYSVIIYVVLVLLGLATFSKQYLVRMFFPVINGNYWFYSCYFVLCFILPLLKIIYTSMKRIEKEKILVITLLGLSTILPLINPSNSQLSLAGGYSFTWLIVLVFLGAYLKDNYKKFNIKIISIVYVLVLLLQVFLYYKGNSFPKYLWMSSWHGFLLSYNNILVVLSSICVFILLINIRISNKILSKIITFISSSTFSIYLIHLHPSVIDPILSKMLDISKYFGTSKIYYYYFGLILLIFISCLLIDKIRVIIFKLFSKLTIRFDKKLERIDNKISLECD